MGRILVNRFSTRQMFILYHCNKLLQAGKMYLRKQLERNIELTHHFFLKGKNIDRIQYTNNFAFPFVAILVNQIIGLL